jgi:hypothetical protein
MSHGGQGSHFRDFSPSAGALYVSVRNLETPQTAYCTLKRKKILETLASDSQAGVIQSRERDRACPHPSLGLKRQRVFSGILCQSNYKVGIVYRAGSG